MINFIKKLFQRKELDGQWRTEGNNYFQVYYPSNEDSTSNFLFDNEII